ncbi:Mut7-C ubiquitin/RNAse domain-containing protein [Sessilibacter corallicola]|uniref:Mut7-C ubiquitin/RNAse domain-containing protein n=1 Tax=Sessilibacter corallicola TaxID=2904075 RepID=UPI001E4C4651|nr:Mut7-C ubiquitin/RNAse domain-containing protein [Sessilibacter corallicola]MCE2030495.1 Mut7-C ubiquitin/RNAse domain-containing protein [Sessilibacter corallicola]
MRTCVMPFYLSKKVFKQQTKTLVAHWPFGAIKTTHARNLLGQFYGYKDDHDFQKTSINHGIRTIPVTQELVLANYVNWVKKLADLGSMNQIQAKKLLHQLWPGYLSNHISLHEKLYQATLRFHGNCNNFLNNNSEISELVYRFDDRPSIKDTIEACGIPHPEIGAITINNQWVEFGHQLQNGDRVEVYPNPHKDASISMPYKPSGELTFLLDVHLKGLARYLRLAGFNCLHNDRDLGDELLAEISSNQDYLLLTRDIGLLKRGNIKYARWIRNQLPQAQFKEIVDHYQLRDEFKPFTRCVKCNGTIHQIQKSSVRAMLPEDIFDRFTEFKQCSDCKQIYWKGSHFEKIQKILDEARQ